MIVVGRVNNKCLKYLIKFFLLSCFLREFKVLVSCFCVGDCYEFLEICIEFCLSIIYLFIFKKKKDKICIR